MADFQVYNHWSMILIFPVFFYTVFLLLKYTVLTIPIWLPISLIGMSFTRREVKK